MKTIFLNITLFSIFALHTIPTIASDNQDQTEQITQQTPLESPEETTPQETKKLPHIQAFQADRTALLFAGCLFVSIALALTLRELAQTKDELTLYKQTLNKLESQDQETLAAKSLASSFKTTVLSFIAQSQTYLTKMFEGFNPSDAYIAL